MSSFRLLIKANQIKSVLNNFTTVIQRCVNLLEIMVRFSGIFGTYEGDTCVYITSSTAIVIDEIGKLESFKFLSLWKYND
jgi:hypothetical protein